MSLLEEVYAGRGDIAIIETVELSCPAWGEPIYLLAGFEDMDLFVPEIGEYRTFVASSIKVDEPSRDNRGNQKATFAIDNVLGEAQKRIIEAYTARAITTIKIRTYLHINPDMPDSNTLTVSVDKVQIKGSQVQLTGGFFDVIGRNFNRLTYNSETSPALMYE